MTTRERSMRTAGGVLCTAVFTLLLCSGCTPNVYGTSQYAVVRYGNQRCLKRLPDTGNRASYFGEHRRNRDRQENDLDDRLFRLCEARANGYLAQKDYEQLLDKLVTQPEAPSQQPAAQPAAPSASGLDNLRKVADGLPASLDAATTSIRQAASALQDAKTLKQCKAAAASLQGAQTSLEPVTRQSLRLQCLADSAQSCVQSRHRAPESSGAAGNQP